MPELPEVETTRRGLAPLLEGRRILSLEVRERRLRLPVPAGLEARLAGRILVRLERRAKYLLFRWTEGTLLLHLGMSGSLRLSAADAPPGKHEHLRFRFEGGSELRLRDPRRFGLCLWTEEDPARHPLLRALGPEPLEAGFDAQALRAALRGRKAAVKSLLLDGRIVAGVGNIYASEALHLAGVRPGRAGGGLSRAECGAVVRGVRTVLRAALRAGGTSLRDFVGGDGEPGTFTPRLRVYGREGRKCRRCGGTVRARRIGQRNSYWCGDCQR